MLKKFVKEVKIHLKNEKKLTKFPFFIFSCHSRTITVPHMKYVKKLDHRKQ